MRRYGKAWEFGVLFECRILKGRTLIFYERLRGEEKVGGCRGWRAVEPKKLQLKPLLSTEPDPKDEVSASRGRARATATER